MIPQNFESWKDCIERQCGIPLTTAFAQSRIVVYENRDLHETQRFIRLYGEEHLQNVLEWFRRIAYGRVSMD